MNPKIPPGVSKNASICDPEARLDALMLPASAKGVGAFFYLVASGRDCVSVDKTHMGERLSDRPIFCFDQGLSVAKPEGGGAGGAAEVGALPQSPGRLRRKNVAVGSTPGPAPERGLGRSPNGVWGGAPAGFWGQSNSRK